MPAVPRDHTVASLIDAEQHHKVITQLVGQRTLGAAGEDEGGAGQVPAVPRCHTVASPIDAESRHCVITQLGGVVSRGRER